MATKTVKKYAQELYDQSLPGLNSQREAKQKQNDQTYQQIAQAIDKSVAAGVAGYQKSIDAAPTESQKLYDENAVTEAVNRKRVQESMANMGMTDSGLSSSLHTSLAVAKGNADARVRQQEQAYVQQLKTAIDTLRTSGETQKATEKLTLDKGLNDWYQNQQANLWTQSMAAGAGQYAAEQDAAARVAEAQYEAATKQAEARQNYALKLLDNGADETSAWASAYTMYPTGDEKTDAYWSSLRTALESGYSKDEVKAYVDAGGGEAGLVAVETAAIDAAEKFATNPKNSLKLYSSPYNIPFDFSGDRNTWWSKPQRDGEMVASRVAKLIEGNATYEGMTEVQKAATVKELIARNINDYWHADKENADNETRIRAACYELNVNYEDVIARYTQLREK